MIRCCYHPRDTGLPAASSPGWEIPAGGRWEEGGPPPSPSESTSLGWRVRWGLSSSPGTGFPFPLTLTGRKLGLILMTEEFLPLP